MGHTGMAANLVSEHARKGLHAFSETEGLLALTYCLQQSSPIIQAADIRWQQLTKFGPLPPWLSELVAITSQAEQGYLIALLEQSSKDQRSVILKNELTKFIKETLGVVADQEIPATQSFFEMGMDSLMAIELRNKIQVAIGHDYAN